TDYRQPVAGTRVILHRDALADRVLIRPHQPCDRLTDDHDAWSRVVIMRREVAPANDSNPHRAEVAGAHGRLADGVSLRKGRAILDREVAHDSHRAHRPV